MKPPTVAKAIVGAVVAGLAFAIPVVDDGLTLSEILGIIAAALAGGGAVWGIPNAPKPTA